MVLTDEHRYPFSLFSESKESDACKVERAGNVADDMDRTIGRAVVRIKGAVSANNYIDFSNLQLMGNFICIQLCPLKGSIATLHIELVTRQDISLRVTISTLYDKPRFLGRSLRLPLPFSEHQGWTNVHIDVNEILSKYCQNCPRLKFIRRIQLCSNLIVRDVVSSDQPFSTESTPKDLAVIPQASGMLSTLNMSKDEYYLNTYSPSSNEAYSQKKKTGSNDSPISKGKMTSKNSPSLTGISEAQSPSSKEKKSKKSKHQESFATPQKGHGATELDTPDLIELEDVSPRVVGEDFQTQKAHRSAPSKSRLMAPKVVVPRHSSAHRSQSLHADSIIPSVTVKPQNATKSTVFASVSERVLGLERIMGYDGGPVALLYNGGMIALASGPIIILVDVRLRDADSCRGKNSLPNPSRYSTGLWRAFKSSTLPTSTENYPQAFLRGHSSSISNIEVSMDGCLMVSSETGVNAKLVLWDLQEGKRLAVLQPHAETVQSVHFSADSTMLCTSGWDHLRRIQVIVWDIATLVNASSGSGVLTKESSKGVVLARQLSDFHISEIIFSPFEDQSLVSCGRENIRFWRMRKNHLPGRPVHLGEYSRGYMFTNVAYVNAPALNSNDGGSVNRIMGDRAASAAPSSSGLRPCVFVASSLGLLLRVDCILEQVVCAYQLHNGPIRSMSINSAYAVTGGDDCKLRIWPLQFTDFLMEAYHEAAVSNVFVSQDAKLLTVGTSSGTLGVLDVFDHRYWTVLRSHVGAVVSVACRAPVGDEFLTVGGDNTIRLWDTLSGQQKFEFDSPQDTPLCGAYHPTDHVIACGFDSGTLRIFDVESTSTLFERTPQPQHASALVQVQYSSGAVGSYMTESVKANLLLYTVSIEGRLTVYDVRDSYCPLRSLSVCSLLDNARSTTVKDIPAFGKEKDCILAQRLKSAVQMSKTRDGRLLAISCGTLYSLCIFDTTEMAVVYKGSSLFNSSHATDMHYSNKGSTSSMASTVASLPKPVDQGHGGPASPVNYLVFDQADSHQDASSHHLLIVTDRRIVRIVVPSPVTSTVSPAVLGATYGESITQNEISSRRFDSNVVPVAGAIDFDSSSGLFFIAARLKEDTSGAAVPSEDNAVKSNCLLVVGVSSKGSQNHSSSQKLRHKLFLTCSQVLTDLPGNRSILSISTCGAASNKVLLSDSSGCVSVWHMREERIKQLRDKGSPIEPVVTSPEDEDEDARYRPFGLQDLHGDAGLSESHALEAGHSPENSFFDVHRSGVSMSLKESDIETFYNINDDPIDDPVGEGANVTLISKTSVEKKVLVRSTDTSISDVLHLENEYSQKETNEIQQSQDDILSATPTKSQSDVINQSFGSDTEHVGYQMTEAHFATEHFSDDESESAESIGGLEFSVCAHKRSMDGKSMRGHIILERMATCPCFCASDNTLALSNGTHISVTEVSPPHMAPSSASQLQIDPHYIKKLPEGTDIKQTVRVLSYAPSGLFIAAVVDVYLSRSGDRHYKSTHRQAPSELHVWCRSASPSDPDAWRHLGAVTLHTAAPQKEALSSHPATVGWTGDDSLLLLVPVPIPDSARSRNEALTSPSRSGALLSITNWVDQMADGSFSGGEMPSPFVSTPGTPTIDMPGIPLVLPFLSKPDGVEVINEWCGPPCDCALASWGDAKVAVFAVDANRKDALAPLWVKDLGRNGPLLSVHLAEYVHVYTECSKNHLAISKNTNVVTPMHKSGGRSFEEKTVASHHVAMESKADELRTQSGILNAARINQQRVSGKRGALSAACKTVHTGCDCCDAIYQSYPLLVSLDSVGSIVFSRLTFDQRDDQGKGSSRSMLVHPPMSMFEKPASCGARVSLAHVTGHPRTMTLSANAEELALASTNCVQIFKVSIKDSPSPFSVALAFQHKVVVPFNLDYLLFLPSTPVSTVTEVAKEAVVLQRRKASQSKILCAGRCGSACIIPARQSAARGDKSRARVASSSFASERESEGSVSKRDAGVILIRSAPPFGRADEIVSLPIDDKSSKIAVLNKQAGEVALINGSSGKQVITRLAGNHSSYSMAACDAFLALGSKCGRVSIYLNNNSVDLRQVVSLRGGTSVPPTSSSSSSQHDGLSNVSIKELSIVSSGKAIVALRMDNSLFVIKVALITKAAVAASQGQVVTNVKCEVSIPVKLHTAPTSVSHQECHVMKHEYHFFPCFGDDHLFGCVRGHTLHIYTLHEASAVCEAPPKSKQSKSKSSPLRSAPRLVRLASYRLVTTPEEIFDKAHSMNNAYDEDEDSDGCSLPQCQLKVQAVSVHLARLFGSQLQITAIGHLENTKIVNESSTKPCFMFVGSEDISTLSGGLGPKEGTVSLHPCFSVGRVSSTHCLDEECLGVTGYDGVRLYSISRVQSVARKLLLGSQPSESESAVDMIHDSCYPELTRIFGSESFQGCCRGVFHSTLQPEGTQSSHLWSQTKLTLHRRGDGACDAFVYCTQGHSPVMYKVTFS